MRVGPTGKPQKRLKGRRELGPWTGIGLWEMRNVRLAMPFLSQDDLRNQAQKLKQHLTDTEAEKSQVQTELQDLQRQLSQNQEGEKLKAGTGIWREERRKAGSPAGAGTGLAASLYCLSTTVRRYLEASPKG